MGFAVTKKSASYAIDHDLLIALESARTQLAVAIAVERKSTPRDQWHYYLDTAERMSRFMRKLRRSGVRMEEKSKEMVRIQSALRRISVGANAQNLCRILREIATESE